MRASRRAIACGVDRQLLHGGTNITARGEETRAIRVIKGSIELWPTLVEICYFHKSRTGLPQVRVKNQQK